MMDGSDIIRELKTFYREGVSYRDLDHHLTDADVDRWRAVLGWSRFQIFEAIAECLAIGYNTSELSFEFCGKVVNDLFNVVITTSGSRPQLFWEVFLAFDAGEYFHGDNRDEDPGEIYTRPLVARIAERIHGASTTQSLGLDK